MVFEIYVTAEYAREDKTHKLTSSFDGVELMNQGDVRKSGKTFSGTYQKIFSCASSGDCVTMQNVSLRVEDITYQNNNSNLYYLYIYID